MKYLYGFIILVIIVILIQYINSGDKMNNYNKISFAKMYQMIEENIDYKIIDVRTKEEYNDGRIPKSISLPLAEISNITNIISYKDKTLFIYCRSGVRSREASIELINMGYTKVYDVGGIIEYSQKLEY